MGHDQIRRMTADDIYNFRLISEPSFSPDATRVSYVVTTIERDKNDYRSSINIAPVDSSGSRRLTHADAKDSLPRWSPDGKHIAFLSNRSEKTQVWLIRADGGEAWQASSLSEGVTSYEWSPDGASFVVVSKSTEASEAAANDASKAADEEKSDVRHITKIRYKADGEGFLDFKPKHLWLVPAFGGSPQQLTDADIDDSDPVWSPNGREIAYITNRSDGREMNNVSQIWSIVATGKEERPILGGDDASFESPSWSPDGSQLAVIGSRDPVSGGAKNANLWVVPAAGGRPENLTGAFDRSVEDSAMSDVFAGSMTRPRWTSDGRSVLTLVSDSGSTHIYRVSIDGKDVSRVTGGDRRISAFSIDNHGKQIAYISGTATSPGDLYVANLDGSDERQLTDLNKEFLSSVTLSEPEAFYVTSQSDDTEIQGWVMKPVGFDPGKKYPMILQIHGGPHGMYSNHMMHEFQLMAARGYVVVYCNPRGSSGYGEAFTTYTHMAWGEKDMPDVMAAVDHVVAQGYVDENRLGITGGSYGGYMTLWMIGHSDRFKAAVTQRCVSNLHSFYGTSDIGFTFGEYEFGGTAWEKREHFMKYSPISYVEQMKTPLLIVHSEQDFRCPIEQAEQVFISLKRLGREVEFVRIPDENHNLSRTGKPKHRIERLEHIVGWFDKHL